MSEIARVSDYDGLVKALRARRIELGLTHLAVDEIAGLQTGYTGKIECGIKRLGVMSLTAILGALKVEMALLRAAGGKANSVANSWGWVLHRKKLAEKGQRAFMRDTTPAQRRANARKAGLARQAKHRREKRTRPQVEEV